MAQADRQRWDSRYAENEGDYSQGPTPLLVKYAPLAGPHSRALELACGLGRNALWLAEQGYRVDALDISLEALRQGQQEARRRGLAGIHFIAADLDDFPLPNQQYDLVVVFRFLDRRLFPAIRERVRPGGLAIYETLNVGHLQEHPETSRYYLLEWGELPHHFPGWTALHTRDGSRMSAFVGRKPE